MFSKPKVTSPNFNERAGYDAPNMIILHYTGMKTGKAAIDRLCDPEFEVSAHYVIDRKGKLLQLVEDQKRAWHAGKAYWAGQTDINSASIGVEIVNPGHEFGYEAFKPAQIKTLVKLCQRLVIKYNIPPSRILGHSDIAPGRKLDPGHLFPWADLAALDIGLWPVPTEMDYQAAEDMILNQSGFVELLYTLGYSPEASCDDVIVAFHRHFYPEKFGSCDDRPVEPDVLSCARLLALVRQTHEET